MTKEEKLGRTLCEYLDLKIEPYLERYGLIKIFPVEDRTQYMLYDSNWKDFLFGCPGRLSIFDISMLSCLSGAWQKRQDLMKPFLFLGEHCSSVEELELQLAVRGF